MKYNPLKPYNDYKGIFNFRIESQNLQYIFTSLNMYRNKYVKMELDLFQNLLVRRFNTIFYG